MLDNRDKKCVSCLHCKVSIESEDGEIYCYCVKKKNKKLHKLDYWEKKNVCVIFDDMDDEEGENA